MGTICESITVYVHVSSHNSERDATDREAYERLRRQIQELINADPVLKEIACLVR